MAAKHRADFKDNLHDCGDCTFIPCPNNLTEYHAGEITVAIDGTCRDNGSTTALTAYDVYFARESPFNEGLLTGDVIASGDRADLVACIETLDTVKGLTHRLKKGHTIEGLTKLHRVIIKHTSYFLISTMGRIEKWNTTGWPNSIRHPVSNLELFQAIDQKIKTLDDLGVYVHTTQKAARIGTMSPTALSCGDNQIMVDTDSQIGPSDSRGPSSTKRFKAKSRSSRSSQ
ncbi:MAG: hypothetical protein LQ350_007762 [Teloschistes chrysophthalmus]|nr:MAG: hypothetical protein LQ350_007762 [Niorma chrysophthalma]